MGFAEEELQIAWMRLIVKILSESPSARCPFSYIIMEKGGYLVGVVNILMCLLYLPLFVPPKQRNIYISNNKKMSNLNLYMQMV